MVQHTNYRTVLFQKNETDELRKINDNSTVYQTKEEIHQLTFSTISNYPSYELEERLSRDVSLDENSPVMRKSAERMKQYKLGKLLGVGKSAHVYLCEESQTGWLAAIKEIFKKTISFSVSDAALKYRISRFMDLYHPKIVSIFSYFETEDKICLLTEFCFRTAYEELKEARRFPLIAIRVYLSDLIEGVSFLHENQIIHGNINLFQVFLCFNECKIKPSLCPDS